MNQADVLARTGLVTGTFLLQLSCPCRQQSLSNGISKQAFGKQTKRPVKEMFLKNRAAKSSNDAGFVSMLGIGVSRYMSQTYSAM
eukprot:349482-Pelagomonas_calceolata.AAC.1